MTKSFLEDKIVSILTKTLSNMLLSLFQEAMHQTRVQISQQAPQMTSSVEIVVVSIERELPLV